MRRVSENPCFSLWPLCLCGSIKSFRSISFRLNFLRHLHTVRTLKPVQVYGRLWFLAHKPKVDLRPAPALRVMTGQWTAGVLKPQTSPGPGRFVFLHREHELARPADWNNRAWDKLWLYNLHYFDDLNAEGRELRESQHLALMNRWVDENSPGQGNGWEPYPLSLRIVNWVKWALADNPLSSHLLNSLAIQVRYLRRRLEVHILGNHLLANAKALVFAGLFFSGREAQAWLNKGMDILSRQVPEQVLPDGGHFERSPMYHAIILEDLLDLVNMARTFAGALPGKWRCLSLEWVDAIQRMSSWLRVMSHPDKEIALFNDAAFGIAPTPGALEDYAARLGISMPGSPASLSREGNTGTPHGGEERVSHLTDTGYVRVQMGPAVAFLDVAPIGPDYLPGHGHADSLSFELSLNGRRVIVDSGTSCYGSGQERMRQRSTAAHNTVMIDGEDSSEVWGSFRVARRARPFGLKLLENEDETLVTCAHDGYRRLPGKAVHCREWRFKADELSIRDLIKGRFSQAVGRFHFHPGVQLEMANSRAGGDVILPGGQRVSFEVLGGRPRVRPSTYHPEFGVSLEGHCLEVEFTGPESCTIFRWN
jgi:uncharacterized heparinase superfamily protein